MAQNRGAILLIADISGFTRFLKQPAVSAAHAREIVVRLLNALVAETRPPLLLAEIEGDALFLYALDEGKGLPATPEEVKKGQARWTRWCSTLPARGSAGSPRHVPARESARKRPGGPESPRDSSWISFGAKACVPDMGDRREPFRPPGR